MSDPLVNIDGIHTTLDGALLEPGPGQGGVNVGKDARATHISNLVIRAQPAAETLSVPMPVLPAKPSFGSRVGGVFGWGAKVVLTGAAVETVKRAIDGM